MNGNGQQQTTKVDELPPFVGTTIDGPIILQFPTRMFDPAGELEYRLHRSRFMEEMLKLYDEMAEKAREWINAQDPSTVRPPLNRLSAVSIDISAMTKAAAPDPADEEDDH